MKVKNYRTTRSKITNMKRKIQNLWNLSAGLSCIVDLEYHTITDTMFTFHSKQRCHSIFFEQIIQYLILMIMYFNTRLFTIQQRWTAMLFPQTKCADASISCRFDFDIFICLYGTSKIFYFLNSSCSFMRVLHEQSNF